MLLLMTTLPLPLYLPNSLYLTNLPNIMSRCGPDFSISDCNFCLLTIILFRYFDNMGV
jgi:hypothetical protein